MASNQSDSPAFNVYTVADKSPITARNGLSVIRHLEQKFRPFLDVLGEDC